MSRAGKRWARGAVPAVVVLTLLILTIRTAAAIALTGDGDRYLALSKSSANDFTTDPALVIPAADQGLIQEARAAYGAAGTAPSYGTDPVQVPSESPFPSSMPTPSMSGFPTPEPSPTPTRQPHQSLTLTSDRSSAMKCDAITFTIVFHSNVDVYNVKLSAPLPAGTQRDPCRTGLGISGAQPSGGGDFTWPAQDVQAGVDEVQYFKVYVSISSGEIAEYGTATWDVGHSLQSNTVTIKVS